MYLILTHKSKNREVREASEENAKKALCFLSFFICEKSHAQWITSSLTRTKRDFIELRIDNQLDEKTEIIIRSIIGAAIDVHRELRGF